MSLPDTTRGALAWKGAILALVIVTLVLSRPDSASAHANLADADPAPNSVLDTAPSKITIRFTEPLEPSFSAIEVLDSRGRRVDNDDSAVDPANPTVMSVTLRDDLPNGTYTVAWRNLSTVDGHTIRGTFFYSVGEPLSVASSDLASETVLLSPAEPFMRWAVLLGGLSVLGVLTLWLVVLRPPLVSMSDAEDLVARVRDRTDKIAMTGIVVALLGSIGHLLVQASSVPRGVAPRCARRTGPLRRHGDRVGQGMASRTSLLIGALGPIWALLRLRKAPSTRRDTALWISAFLVTALAMATLSATSHGAATPGIELAATRDRLHPPPRGGLLGWRTVRTRAYSSGRLLPFARWKCPSSDSRRPPAILPRGRAERRRAHRHRPLQRMGASHRPARARRPIRADPHCEDGPGGCPLGLRCHEPAVAHARHTCKPQGRVYIAPNSHRRSHHWSHRHSSHGLPDESRTGPAGRVPGRHRYSAKSDLPGHSGGDHHRCRNRAGTIRSEHGDRYACRPSRRSDCECLGSGHTPVLPRR